MLSLAERQSASKRIRTKYADRIPVILQKDKESRLPLLTQSKYLVPDTLTVAELLYVARKRIKLDPCQGLFFMAYENLDGKKVATMPETSQTMSILYNRCHDEDGFLYIYYTEENTFGAGTAPCASVY